MKIIYEILYKNGHEDVMELPITKQHEESIERTKDVIINTFNNYAPGYLSMCDGDVTKIVDLSEVSRVNYRISEE